MPKSGKLKPANISDLGRSLDLTTGPVLAVSQDGIIRIANSRIESLLGYEPGELRGQSIEILVPDEVRQYHPELREAFFVVPHERSMGTGRDLFAKRKDGSLVPVEIGLTPFKSDSEALVIASISDITERRSQQEKIRLAMDAASSAMVMVDHSGRIVLANQQACRSFGYQMEELLGESVDMLVPQDIQRRHGVYVSSFLRSPGHREMGKGRTVTAQRKDGDTFPVEITLSPIDAHDGSFVMSTIIDISDRKRAEAENERINADLVRLNEDLSSFVYSASHDLKAPLSTIRGLLRYVDADLESGNLDEAKANVERCMKLSDQLGHRVEDALAVARSDHDSLNASSVDLEVLFRDVKESIADHSSGNDVLIEIVVDEGNAIFVTDATRLARIVENLLTNAVKYSDPARAKRWVRLEAKTAVGELLISCEDNGLGFPEGSEMDVFKMFKRFHPDAAAGSGLGLALVKKCVDQLMGEISFSSESTGTRFEITLPSLGDWNHA